MASRRLLLAPAVLLCTGCPYDEIDRTDIAQSECDEAVQTLAAEIYAAPDSLAPHVKVFDGETGALVHSFFAFPDSADGVAVGAADLDGDQLADIVASAGADVKGFNGLTLAELEGVFVG